MDVEADQEERQQLKRNAHLDVAGNNGAGTSSQGGDTPGHGSDAPLLETDGAGVPTL